MGEDRGEEGSIECVLRGHGGGGHEWQGGAETAYGEIDLNYRGWCVGIGHSVGIAMESICCSRSGACVTSCE